MDNVMVWVWLSVTVVSLIVEVVTIDFVSLWFCVAAAISIGLSFIPGFPWWGQVILFALLSIILLLILRPICKKFFNRKGIVATNVDSLVGQRVKLLTATDKYSLGSAKIGDVVWSVKGDFDCSIEQGAEATVVRVEGNKLIVAPLTETRNDG